MIIREIKINSFGGLKDFEINLNNGINIIYGENEKGKSTTEEFIKIMLYGFSKKKINGESERKRYIPFDGGVIGGELLIEHRGKEYRKHQKQRQPHHRADIACQPEQRTEDIFLFEALEHRQHHKQRAERAPVDIRQQLPRRRRNYQRRYRRQNRHREHRLSF